MDSLVRLQHRYLHSLASAGLERAGRHLASLRSSLKGFDIWSPTKVYVIHFSPSRRFPNLEKQNHRIPWTPHIPQASEHSLNRQLSISDTYIREERMKPHKLLPLALLLHKTNLIFPPPAYIVPGDGNPPPPPSRYHKRSLCTSSARTFVGSVGLWWEARRNKLAQKGCWSPVRGDET